MSTVGYARVSTDHQNLAAQTDALDASGCERVFTDQFSGVAVKRPGLAALLDYVRPGDTVVVTALDRLGRSLLGVIATIETLAEAGVLLKSLREGIDYSTSTGKMLAGIFAALASYERELMQERAAARALGRQRGRPPRLSAEQVRQVHSLRGCGEPIGDLASIFTVSRATIYRALQQESPDETSDAGQPPLRGQNDQVS